MYTGPNIITDGLVLYLDAANTKSYTSGSTSWNDLSGLGNNGTLTNGPTFSSANGGSIVFDGSNDYVLLPNGLLSGTGNFTVNQFIKCNGGADGATFTNYPAGNLEILFGTNYIGLWLNNSTTYLVNPASQFTTSPIMITAIRSGTTTYFYINAILQKIGSSSSTIGTNAAQFRIGTNTVTTERYNGHIFSTQVYNRAFTADEILQNYNATKSRFNL